MEWSGSSKVILHVVVVGFHHKKGCQVEYSYPPLIKGQSHDSVIVPDEWKYLPFLALPDGAHNYSEDTIYFHLPPRNEFKQQTTVYCISCYRQISAELLRKRDVDVTRETVQKSVVVLSQVPLYGILNAKLHMITQAYFEEKDFSKISILQDLFEQINQSMNITNDSQRFLDVPARTLVLKFHHQVVMLFKLVLLERRLLFYGSPVKTLVGGIMALLSLFPNMIDKGLSYCTTSLDKYVESVKQTNCVPKKNSTIITPVTKQAKHFPESGKMILEPDEANTFNFKKHSIQRQKLPHNPTSSETNFDFSEANLPDKTENTSPIWSATTEKALDVASTISTRFEALSSALTSALYNEESLDSTEWAVVGEIDDDEDIMDSSFRNARLEIKTDSPAKCPTNSNSFILANPEPNCETVDVMAFDGFSSPLNCDQLGFPLSIFTRGYMCLPYVALQQHGDLMQNLERGYVIGATNVLFKTHEHLCDAVVDLDECLLNVRDPNIKRLLHLSAADLRFAEYLVNSVSCEEDDAFGSTGWEGGDEWIQAQFLDYMLAMLTISLEVNARPKDVHDFNEYFIAAWKQTQNYKVWKNGAHTAINNVKPQHPYQGQYSVSDMRLRLHHNLQSSDRGRKIEDVMTSANQVVSSTSKLMGSAFVSAKSSVASWWTNREKKE